MNSHAWKLTTDGRGRNSCMWFLEQPDTLECVIAQSFAACRSRCFVAARAVMMADAHVSLLGLVSLGRKPRSWFLN